MKNKSKKILAIAMCLIFVFTIAESTTSRVLNKSIKEDKKSEIKTITLYRHGLDGVITEVNADIILTEGIAIEKAIQDKCEELFKNDIEFNNYMKAIRKDQNNSNNNTENNTNLSYGLGLFFVVSRGKGIHFQTKMLGKLLLKLLALKLKAPKIIRKVIKLRKQMITCSYNNERSFTYINPIASIPTNTTQNSTQSSIFIRGQHSISLIGFKGYTSWFKRVKFSKIFAKSLSGFCNFYSIMQ